MNNKGFAVSTVIYGLSILGIMLMAILIGVMSVNRSNNRKMSETIEDDLIRYSKTEVVYSASESDQVFSVPDYESGWYRIELWGPAGSGSNAYGAYTSGIIKLSSSQSLSLTVRKEGSKTSTSVKVNNKEIMRAAAGGDNAGEAGGTLSSYTSNSISSGGRLNDNNALTTKTLVGYPTSFKTEGDRTSYIAGYATNKRNVQDLRADGYYFIDGMMLPAVNSGAGKARIERVIKGNKALRRINDKLVNVSKITDCVDAPGPYASKISAIKEGKDLVDSNLTVNGNCREVTLLPAKDLDEIVVWHSPAVDYKNHTISVVSKGVPRTLKAKSSATALSETETPTGFRISAYQFDSTGYLPLQGNYYLQPVLSENKFLTAAASTDLKNNAISMEYYNGYKRQKWSIELITNKNISTKYVKGNTSTYEYKILDLARYNALNINENENKTDNFIISNTPFNNKQRNDPQIWKIIPLGNGTYRIASTVESYAKGTEIANIYPRMNINGDSLGKVVIGKNNTETQRFKIIPINYSSE